MLSKQDCTAFKSGGGGGDAGLPRVETSLCGQKTKKRIHLQKQCSCYGTGQGLTCFRSKLCTAKESWHDRFGKESEVCGLHSAIWGDRSPSPICTHNARMMGIASLHSLLVRPRKSGVGG